MSALIIFKEFCYLFAIKLLISRLHNPPPYKNCPTKETVYKKGTAYKKENLPTKNPSYNISFNKELRCSTIHMIVYLIYAWHRPQPECSSNQIDFIIISCSDSS